VRRTLPAVLLLTVLLVFTLSAKNFGEVDMWFPGISGKIVDETNNDPTTNTVDLKRDLNLKDEQFYFFYLNFGNFGFGRVDMDYHGDGNVTKNFTFGGNNYAPNERVITDVSLSMNDFDFHWYFTRTPIAQSFGIVRLRYIDASARVEGETSGVEEESAQFPVPMVGFGFSSDLVSLVKMRGEVLWVGYAGNHFLDARAGVSYSFGGMSFLTAVGYRYMLLKADVEDVSIDISVKGPYLFFVYYF